MTSSWRWPWLAILAFAALLSWLPGFGAAQSDEEPVQVERNVLYGEADGYSLLLDVYRPTRPPTGLLPAIIIVHGGAWVIGDKTDLALLAWWLADQGYVAFSVNYRLMTATTNQHPAQLDDVQRAVRWIRANASHYGIDPNRLGAVGQSAGGHLVSLLGTRETRDNSDRSLSAYSSRVTCVVDLSGPIDLTAPFPRQDPVYGADVQQFVVDFLGQSPEDAPGLARDASPIFHIDDNTVPFLIAHGTLDPVVPVDQARRFYDALRSAGVDATYLEFADEGHLLFDPTNLTTFVTETVLFLDWYLKR